MMDRADCRKMVEELAKQGCLYFGTGWVAINEYLAPVLLGMCPIGALIWSWHVIRIPWVNFLLWIIYFVCLGSACLGQLALSVRLAGKRLDKRKSLEIFIWVFTGVWLLGPTILGKILYIWIPAGGYIFVCLRYAHLILKRRRTIMQYKQGRKKCEDLIEVLLKQKVNAYTETDEEQPRYWWEESFAAVDAYRREYDINLGAAAALKWEEVPMNHWGIRWDQVFSWNGYAMRLFMDVPKLKETLLQLQEIEIETLMHRRKEEDEGWQRCMKMLQGYRLYECVGTVQREERETDYEYVDKAEAVEEKLQKWNKQSDFSERLDDRALRTNQERYNVGERSVELEADIRHRENMEYLYKSELEEKNKYKSDFRSITRTRIVQDVYHVGYCITTNEPRPRLVATIIVLENGFMGDLPLMKYALYRIPGLTLDIYAPTPAEGDNIYQAYAAYCTTIS